MHCAQLLFPFYGGDLTKDCFVYELIKSLIKNKSSHPFKCLDNLRRYINGQRELSCQVCHLILGNFDKNSCFEFLSTINDCQIKSLIKSFRKLHIKVTKRNFKEVLVSLIEKALSERIISKYKKSENNQLSYTGYKDIPIKNVRDKDCLQNLLVNLIEISSDFKDKSFINTAINNFNHLMLIKSLDASLQYKSHTIINDEVHIFCETPKLKGRKIRSKRIRKVKDVILNGLKVILNITTRRYDPLPNDPNSKYISDSFNFVSPYKRRTNRLNFLTQDG